MITLRYQQPDSSAALSREAAGAGREYRVRALEGQPAVIQAWMEYPPTDPTAERFGIRGAIDHTTLRVLPSQILASGTVLLEARVEREMRRPGRTTLIDRVATSMRVPLGEWVILGDNGMASSQANVRSAEAGGERMGILLKVDLAP